jgi:GntR family transcriptional regulator, transcriptional repressor for pyruvate dehydrogenase complex
VSAMYDARQRTVEYAVDLRQSAEMHRAIYHAIRARDTVAARKAMEQHLLLAETAQVNEAALPSQNGARRRNTNGRPGAGESKRRARAGD